MPVTVEDMTHIHVTFLTEMSSDMTYIESGHSHKATQRPVYSDNLDDEHYLRKEQSVT